jgi:hypothetical protein
MRKLDSMTTHRFLQVYNIQDTCESKARVCRRGAINLRRIGNNAGADDMDDKATRLERIAETCRRRISPIRPTPADNGNLNPPECKKDCKYRQIYKGFALQKNALRCELASMIVPERCGWNILPGRLGGYPLDYAPCYFK